MRACQSSARGTRGTTDGSDVDRKFRMSSPSTLRRARRAWPTSLPIKCLPTSGGAMSRPIKVAEDLIHQIPSDLFLRPLDARLRGLLFTARDEVILQRLSSLTAPCFVLSLLDAIYESAKVSIAMQRRRVAPRARWAKVRSVSHTSPAAALSRAREVRADIAGSWMHSAAS